MPTFPSVFRSYPNVFIKGKDATEYTFKYKRDGSTYTLKDNYAVYSSSGKVGNWKWDDKKLTINFDGGKKLDWDLNLLRQLEDVLKPPPTPPTPPKPAPKVDDEEEKKRKEEERKRKEEEEKKKKEEEEDKIVSIDCKPWTTDNNFINDFKEEERDKRAFDMVKKFNNEFPNILDSTFLDACGGSLGDIDNNLAWCWETFGVTLKKDLHKHPIVRWISKVRPGKQDWYDYWATRFLKESKLKLQKKLNEMKTNKKIDKQINELVSKKIKSKKIEKELKTIFEDFDKQNYRKFFSNLFSKEKNSFLTEGTNEDFDKSFEVIFKGKENEFKNRAIEFILNKLEVDINSDLGKEIKLELDSVPAKDIFKNEYDVPEAILRSVEKISNQTNKEESGLKGIVSKSIRLDDKQLKQGVRQHLQDYIENVKTDIKALEEKIKSSIIGM